MVKDCLQTALSVVLGFPFKKALKHFFFILLTQLHIAFSQDASFDIDVQMGSGTGFQYEAPEANYTAGSVTLHCPNTASSEIIASVALDQTALAIHQEDYQTSFTNSGTY